LAKDKTVYECQNCGCVVYKWLGKCQDCGGWDSFVELTKSQKEFLQTSKISITKNFTSEAISILDIQEDDIERLSTDDNEFDLVLGGGIVSGSLTLIGGSPGVGKSTLLIKVAGNLAKNRHKVLYVSGEESNGQIKLRANRLNINSKDIYLLSEIKLENIQLEISKGSYECVVIDSIQTVYSQNLTSAPGSVSQVREIAFSLMRLAKETKISIFLIGHITKDGSIAGPRVLEHMVDTVLYFEGESSSQLRILRGFKNRFGNTNEIGIFEMTKDGLISAKNVSTKFLNNQNPKPGSALTVLMEGSRSLIIEVQALVSESSFPNPKRSSTGFDTNRLTMLLALLEKKLDLPFNGYDVFINIAGGIKINETAADLAVVAAIISSFRNRPISNETIFLGEVSLVGDVRDVYNIEQRLKEAKSQNISKAIIPSTPQFEIDMKCFQTKEVSKLIDWM